MSCIERSFRNILAAVLIALVFAIAPAAVAAPRAADRPARADDGGWTALLGPWRALEQWLDNITAADEGEGDGEGEGGGEGEGEGDPAVPPTCPPGQNPGPCSDPGG